MTVPYEDVRFVPAGMLSHERLRTLLNDDVQNDTEEENELVACNNASDLEASNNAQYEQKDSLNLLLTT